MSVLARALVAARGWLRPAQVDRDLSEELAFHIEREAQANREAGMTPAEAWRAARLAVGGLDVLREASRDDRPGEAVRRLARDCRHAVRQLRRDAGYAISAVLTLALSIGATTAIYSAVEAVLLNPVPIRDPSRVIVGWESVPERNLPVVELSYRYIERIASRSESLVSAGGVGSTTWPTLMDVGGEPVRVAATGVTATLFDTLGVAPLHGRMFRSEDDLPGAPRVVILSHAFWSSKFGADVNVLGRTIGSGDASASIYGPQEPQRAGARVVGVMPPGFDYPMGTDVWMPVVPVLVGSDADPEPALVGVGVLYLVGRLRDGVTIAHARAELESLEAGLGPTGGRIGSGLQLTPIAEHVLGPVGPALWALFVAVSILLAIGCANVSALMLTRLNRRRRELGVRLALGASAGAVARLWIAQSLLLSLVGGAAGLLVARWLAAVLMASAPPDVPRVGAIPIDASVRLFAFATASLTALLCAILPVRESARTQVLDALAGGGRSTADRRSHRIRSSLLSAQAALSVVLLVAAALAVRSFLDLRSVELGFNPERVIALHVEPRSGVPTSAGQWMEELLHRVRARGDVEAAGAVALRPLGAGVIGDDRRVALEGQTDRNEDTDRNPLVNYQTVTHGYFETMGIRLREGRIFNADDTATSPRVVVIGESAARRLWPHAPAIGQRLLVSNESPDPSRAWRTVIGVVADVRYRGLNDVRNDVYDLAIQSRTVADDIVIRTRADAASLASDVRAEARRLDPRAVLDEVTTMEAIVARAMAPWRFGVWVFVLFAVAAMSLTGIGLFTAVSLDADSRRRELAIRLALGATPRDLVRDMLTRAMRRLAPGLAGGFLAAPFAPRVLDDLLFGVTTLDPVTAVAVGVFVALAFMSASLWPALAAAGASPASALAADN